MSSQVHVEAITVSNYKNISAFRRNAARSGKYLVCIYAQDGKVALTIRPPLRVRFSQCAFSNILRHYRDLSNERMFERAGAELRLRDLPETSLGDFLASISSIIAREPHQGKKILTETPTESSLFAEKFVDFEDEAKVYLSVLKHTFDPSVGWPITLADKLFKVKALYNVNESERAFGDAIQDWILRIRSDECNHIELPGQVSGVVPVADFGDFSKRADVWAKLHANFPNSPGIVSLSPIGRNINFDHAVVELRNDADPEFLSDKNCGASNELMKRFFRLSKRSEIWSIEQEIRFDEMFWDGEFGHPLTP